MTPWPFGQSRTLTAEGGGPSVYLRGVDVVLVSACSLAALVLVGPGRWAPDALSNAIVFAFFAGGLLVLRMLETAWPRLTHVANFWLLPVAALSHSLLNPVVDAINPGLKDAQLVALDERFFGGQAAVLLSQATPPWLNEVLMVCYYGHFVWPLVLGIVLYRAGRLTAFNEYLLGLSLFFSINYALYVFVPAIGPRFFLFGAFPEPIQGLVLTPYLDSMMRQPTFVRDCFPSGHTGATLLVLFYGFRFSRRFFAVMLLPGLGLITATLAGRFHYATDLMCAVPLVVVVAGLARALSRMAARREEFSPERPVSVDAIVRP